MGHWFRLMSYALTSNVAGHDSCRKSRSPERNILIVWGDLMTLTQIRCAHCGCKHVEGYRTYTIKDGEQRTMYHCSSCDSTFSETKNTPIADLKTPLSVVVQVLAALTEGVGINAATRLYHVSKNSIYRWQERLSGLKKHCSCSL
jgi:transposase-like protein